MKTSEFLSWAESKWPASSAEEWDNPGLITGHPDDDHSRVLITVDITREVLDEAIAKDCSLIVAHHPLLLGGIESLREDSYKGSLLAKAIRSNVTMFSAHTNADIVSDGVSESLAKAFGLSELSAIGGGAVGHGRVGRIKPQTLGEFLELIRTQIPSTAKGISFIGDKEATIETVALVAGSGMGFAELVNADAFITSDIKHHPAVDFKQQSMLDGSHALIEISHYAAESVWLGSLAAQLSETGLRVITSTINTDPWDGVIR